MTGTLAIYQKIRYRLVFNHARRLNKRGEGLIQIEIQQGARRRYISTHTYLPPENWKNGWVVGTPDDNARNFMLRRMMWEVEQVELEYIKKGMVVTLPALMEAVESNVSPSAKLRDFIEAMLISGERKDTTKQNYRTLANDIDRFRPNTYINDIDHQWVQAYERYLKDNNIAHNTRISRLRLLRAVVNEALSRDLMSQDPFRRIKLDHAEAKKGFVTMLQLKALEQLKLTGKEEKCRDLFLVGCYTGLRFSDVKTLRQEHIIIVGETTWLHKKTIKTAYTADNMDLISVDEVERPFFVRWKGTKEEAEALFGTLSEIVYLPELDGEIGVITGHLSEKQFKDLIVDVPQVISWYRRGKNEEAEEKED